MTHVRAFKTQNLAWQICIRHISGNDSVEHSLTRLTR